MNINMISAGNKYFDKTCRLSAKFGKDGQKLMPAAALDLVDGVHNNSCWVDLVVSRINLRQSCTCNLIITNPSVFASACQRSCSIKILSCTFGLDPWLTVDFLKNFRMISSGLGRSVLSSLSAQ